MPRRTINRRLRPFSLALAAWDLWLWLPPAQRRWAFRQARRHGPRIAKQAIARKKKG